VDFSRLNRTRVVVGALASALLVVSVLFLPWFSLTDAPERAEQGSSAWICGTGDHSCTAFETFPVLRWLLLLAAIAPPILAFILVRGYKLDWPPGEMTMVAGMIATVLILYNGLIDRPGDTFGIGLDYGYWLALLAAITIAGVGFTRSLESGARKERKAPGTV
jgi:hypothetical protein